MLCLARLVRALVVLSCCAFAPAALAAPSFTATLDRNVVPVGESVQLSLVFESANPVAAPALPAMPNVTVAPGVSQAQSFTFINGRQSSKITYNYTLIANRPGDVTIPAMSVQVGATALTSQPIQLRIIPANTTQNAQPGQDFIRLVVPKREVYVGEPFSVEINLYARNAKDLRMPQLKADGFSLGQFTKPSQSQTQVGNMVYNLLVFRATATAARAGTLNLGPVEMNLLFATRTDFFGNPVNGRWVTVASEATPIQALPLPAQNVPEGFAGAIGNYQLAVNAGPTNLGVGDPITVRVQISGRGPLDAITLPPQPQWRDFNLYPPTSKVETTDDLGLAGVKSFEQVIIPLNHEVKVLPPLRFSFFDPAARSYRTLTGPAIPLAVRPSATAAAPPSLTNATSNGNLPAADDILHIKPRLELTASATPLLVSQPWFLALQGLPVLAWLSLLVWRKRSELLASNPRLRRQREVAQRIREGLKDLRVHAGARASDKFFATLFRLLQEQLGERLDLPASAITEAVIDDRLRAHHLPEASLKVLHELFQTCNQARYAPVESSQELEALIPKVESALRDLQNLKA